MFRFIAVMLVAVSFSNSLYAESRIDRVLREQQQEYDAILEEARDGAAIMESPENFQRWVDQGTTALQNVFPTNTMYDDNAFPDQINTEERTRLFNEYNKERRRQKLEEYRNRTQNQ